MTEAAQKLKDQLAALSEQDRLEIADFLLSTVEGIEEDAEFAWDEELELSDGEVEEDEWEAELMRRDRELTTGQVQEIPADEVFRELRENRS